MSTDARLLITGFASLEEATTAADIARLPLMGPTRLSVLGMHVCLNLDAACRGLDAYNDTTGLTIVEAASPMRWKGDPLSHPGLRDFISSCVAQFPRRNYFWTGDGTAAQIRWGDETFARGLATGDIQALPTLD